MQAGCTEEHLRSATAELWPFSILSDRCLPLSLDATLPNRAELLMSRHNLEGHAGITLPLVMMFTSLMLRVLQLDSLFRINHTDPWVGGDAHRTSRTINLQASCAMSSCCTLRFMKHPPCHCLSRAMSNLTRKAEVHRR